MKSGRETFVTFPTPLLSSMSLSLSLRFSLSLPPPAPLCLRVPLSRSHAELCVQTKLSPHVPVAVPSVTPPPLTTHTHTHTLTYTHTHPKNLPLISATMLRVVSARRVHTARSGGSARGSPPSSLWLIMWSVCHRFSLKKKTKQKTPPKQTNTRTHTHAHTHKKSSENAPEARFCLKCLLHLGFGAAPFAQWPFNETQGEIIIKGEKKPKQTDRSVSIANTVHLLIVTIVCACLHRGAIYGL